MKTFRGLAGRVAALSSGDVYRAYGRLQGTEPGPLEPVPLAEGAPLRERLYPYRGPAPRAADDPKRWLDDYDKILVERAVLGDGELPGTILRLPMVYGPGDRLHRLFPYVKRMDDGRPGILLDEAMASWRWTRGYVEDVAEGIVAAVIDERSAGRIYNLGEPAALSESEWIRAIAGVIGWAGKIVTVPGERLPGPPPRLNFAQDLITDTSRIRSELGYGEAASLEERLARTIGWERTHPPESVDVRQFDYAAEDEALRLGGG
jgi:nucleoside-diphosphate-sugar epimerase